MAVKSGVGAQFAIGAESTWGTAVTPSTFLPFSTESLAKSFEYQDFAGLQAGALGQKAGLSKQTTSSVGGSVDLAVTTADHQPLFNMLHGNSVSPTTPGGGTNSRTATNNIGATAPDGKGLTVQIGRPDVGGTVRPFTYAGCKVSSVTYTMERGGILTATYQFEGKSETTATGLTSASYSYGSVFSFTGGSIELDDAVLSDCVASASITITLPMATDRYCIGGGALRLEPVLNGLVDVTASLDLEFTSLTQHTAFVAATRRKFELNCTGDTAIEGSIYPACNFTIASTEARGAGPTVQGPDIVRQSVTLKGLDDGSNPLLAIAYTYDSTL